MNDAHKELEKKLNSDEALLQTLLTGVTDTKKANSGGGGGYLGALQAAQKRDADGASEEKQAGTHLTMAEQELKEFQAKFKALKGEAEAGKAKVEKIQKEVDGLRRKVEETGWSAEKETKLNNTVRDLRETVRRLNDVCLSLFRWFDPSSCSSPLGTSAPQQSTRTCRFRVRSSARIRY